MPAFPIRPSFLRSNDIAQGVMNRSAWAIGKPGSTTEKINEMYKAKTGRDLDDTSARNMQAFFALAEAINRAGSTDPEKIRDALSKTDLKPDQLMMGYQGIKYDNTGQNILAATYLIQLHGTHYELVWPERRRPPNCNGRWRARRHRRVAKAGAGRNGRWSIVQVIVGGLLLGAIYALFSSGLTLIWGMMNFINFAHGEFVMLGMYVAFLVVVWLGGGPRDLRHCGGAGFVRARRRHLSVAHPPRHPRADAGADSLDLRAGAACCATPHSGFSRRISCRCRRTRSPARSISAASFFRSRSSSPAPSPSC